MDGAVNTRERRRDKFRDEQKRPLNMKRDLRLYLRIVSFLRPHWIIVILTLIMMLCEAMLGVTSIGMLQPALSLIFNKESINFAKYARKYDITLTQRANLNADGSRAADLEGFFFLHAHVDQALELIDDMADDDPERPLSVHAGAFRAIVPVYLDELATRRPPLNSKFSFDGALSALSPSPIVSHDPIWATDTDISWYAQKRIELLMWLEQTFEPIQVRAMASEPFRFELLKYLIVTLMCLTAIKVVVAYFANTLGRHLGFLVVNDLRSRLYRHTLTLEAQDLSNKSLGDLISRVTSDLSVLQQVVTMIFARFLQSPIKAITFLVGMLLISPQLTAIALLAVLPITLSLLYLSHKVRKSSRRIQEHRADMTDVLQETFGGLRTVKSFGMEEYENARFKKRNDRLFVEQNRSSAIEEMSSQLNEVILVAVVGVLLLVGGYYVLISPVEQRLEPPTFLTFMALIGAMWGPVRSWSRSFVKIQQGLAGGDRVFEMLDMRTSLVERPDAVEYDGKDASIAFHDVTFCYEHSKQVLQGVDLEVHPGTVVALAGRTASGKSTLANLVPRFWDATTGTVRVGGRDVREYTLKSLRKQIALVSQHVTLFDDTVRANIAYGRPDIALEKIIEVAKAANIHDEIVAMPKGYDTPVGGQGLRLSGGQRQRIAIARALLKDAPILLLDEATSALDVETETLVQQALDRLMQGRTVVVIAHRLSTIRHATAIYLLRDGRVVEKGTHEELMKKGGDYAKFVEMTESQRVGLGTSDVSSDDYLTPFPSANFNLQTPNST